MFGDCYTKEKQGLAHYPLLPTTCSLSLGFLWLERHGSPFSPSLPSLGDAIHLLGQGSYALSPSHVVVMEPRPWQAQDNS